MQEVKNYLEKRQKEFAWHPFFNALENNLSIEPFRQFIPQVAFWVFCFQDVLRINEQSIKDPYLYKIARHHRMEDKGHDQWYVHDLEYFYGPNHFTINWLFSREHRTARDISYKLISHAYQLDDEIQRIILLLSLEASGHIFFEKAAQHVSKMGYQGHLKYFDQSHLEVEHAHELFEDEMEKQLFQKTLDQHQRNQAYQLIDQCFQCFSDILMQYFDKEPNDQQQKTQGEQSKHAE